MSVAQWSQTAATNATADAYINWAEGQAPSTVNDSARAMMAQIAKWRDDHGGSITTGGSATAYTITSNQSIGALSASAIDGFLVVATLHARSGASPTLAVDGRAAAAITLDGTTAIPTGYLPAGAVVAFAWDNANSSWVVQERPVGQFGLLPESVKTDSYTVALADAGKVLVANKATTLTFSLPAVSTATNFVCLVRNVGAGTLTLDPNASETIEGATTITLDTGDAALIWCTGTVWYAFKSLALGNAVKLNIASQAEAEAGASSTKLMTPERTAQAIAAQTVRNTFRAHKNGTDQGSISAGSPIKVTFDTEEFDVGSKYDTSNSRWTPAAGNVLISAMVTLTGSGVSDANMFLVTIKKNGTTDIAQYHVRASIGSLQMSCAVTTMHAASGTDYFEVYVEVTGASAKTIEGDSLATHFLGHAI